MKNLRETLRQGFDVNPELYDRVRPRYPEELFETLVQAVELPANASLLEIGPGTGLATEPFARRGYRITAIELGENLAVFSQDKFQEYKNVKVIHSSFEDVDLPQESFDLIYSATAFHWIDPEIRYKKTHRLLKSSGCLAIIGTHHVSDEHGDEFFQATQSLYDKWIPSENNKGHVLPKADDMLSESFDTELFEPVLFKKFPIQIDYDAVAYCELLGTFSDLLSLPKETQEGFLGDMAELIRRDFDNRITKHSVMTLSIGRKS